MATTNNTATASASASAPWGLFLFAVLLVLKVNPGGHLDSVVEDWSWWWITAPLWGPFAIILFVLACIGIGVGVSTILRKRRFEKARKARLARGGPSYPRRY